MFTRTHHKVVETICQETICQETICHESGRAWFNLKMDWNFQNTAWSPTTSSLSGSVVFACRAPFE